MTEIKKGDRISTKFGEGVVTDDYWAYKDRYSVKLDNGSEFDLGASAMRPLEGTALTVNARATTETE